MEEAEFSKGMAYFSAFFREREMKATTIDSVCEGIDALIIDWAAAEKDGTFVPLPDGPPKTSKDRSRIKTVRNRLTLLGYLKKDSGLGTLDLELKQAIEVFQEEAGLEQDGWVGEKETWPALQELVNFETSIDLLKWFNKGKPKNVLLRAVGLRLFVLGLLEKNPASIHFDYEQGMKSFGHVWQRFECVKL